MADFKQIETLPPEIEELMNKDLVEYEKNHNIDVNYKRFSLVMSGDNGEVIGVINAYTAFAEIYIDDMWVHSKYRGKGHGRKLLHELEILFNGKGFNNINLCTNAFNAPDFYKKCGFQLEFTRKNFKNPKLTKYFFVKFFDDDLQTQGIIK